MAKKKTVASLLNSDQRSNVVGQHLFDGNVGCADRLNLTERKVLKTGLLKNSLNPHVFYHAFSFSLLSEFMVEVMSKNKSYVNRTVYALHTVIILFNWIMDAQKTLRWNRILK